MADAADTAAVSAGAAFWVNQSSQQAARLTNRATELAVAAWAGFDGWYDLRQISTRAQHVAQISASAQGSIAHLMAEYVAQMTALLRGTTTVRAAKIGTPEIRGGVDPVRVHARAAYAYREEYAFTGDLAKAHAAAIQREMELIAGDMMLAERAAQADAMTSLGVTHYRRVLRPELSKSGSCGLCIAAADMVYQVADLMPIHLRCKCETMPIIDGRDPARALNDEDIAKVKGAASGDEQQWGTKTRLSNVRVQVQHHGELGPVLTVKGQKFTGSRAIDRKVGAGHGGLVRSGSGSGITPEQATAQLKALEPVLAQLEKRAAAGEKVDGPLAYQRNLVDRLRGIASGK